ncbi:hypothetical protein MLD38_006543 [Melastoma candidum]|uniref:Uncharacterized protein n=1 Tax=Melastoma candidum TaxID=119954 RepID=A0ACB9RPG6_9MYRT|nr:hypothetical protein MLD38_006543 [Melastoma candidum]
MPTMGVPERTHGTVVTRGSPSPSRLYGYVDGTIRALNDILLGLCRPLRVLDGTIRAPPTTITLPTDVVMQNPRLPLWHQTNHSVRALLLATMTPEIIAEVYDVFSAYEICSMINRRFLESTLARELELRGTLITHRLTTQSMAEYLRAMKSTADQLASIGRPVPLSELLLYTLWGLPSQYEHLVTTFSYAIPNLTFD